jgi:hypothetical protein
MSIGGTYSGAHYCFMDAVVEGDCVYFESPDVRIESVTGSKAT